ncbi:MAG TPA: cupredoxin domain-containing protein [Candidatus Eisenbacteria bacterium]|jgi:plastocyanin domain-containing protein
MTPAQVAVTLAGVALAAGVNLYFFTPRHPQRARSAGGGGAPGAAQGVQEVRIRVRDGYDPSVIEVEAGRPVRLLFRREETASCSDIVLIPEWGIAERLPVHQETAVEFTPREPGTYAFACGMNMMRGRIEVR